MTVPVSRSVLVLFVILGLFVLPCLAQSEKARRAMELVKHDHFDEAHKLLLAALADDPGDQQAHSLLAQIAYRQGHFKDSAIHFGKAPSILAGNPTLILQYGEALLRIKSVAEANRVFGSLPKGDAAAQFQAGLLLARFGAYVCAENSFRLAGEDYPDRLTAGYNLGLVQYDSGKLKDCAATLEKLHRSGNKSADVMNLLAQVYTETGRLRDAIETLSEAVKDYPQDTRNYLLAAEVYDDVEQPLAGLDVLDQAIGYFPDSYSLLIERGYLRLSVSKFHDAEADYHKALALRPGSDSAQMGLAFAFLKTGRESEATNLLESLTKSSPGNYFAHYLLGDIYLQRGLDDKALVELRKALSLQPDLGAAHTDLGKVYLKKKEVDSARRELETAVKLDPEDTGAYYKLVEAYRLEGATQKADKALLEVRRLNAKEGKMGTARFLTQRFRDARRAAFAARR